MYAIGADCVVVIHLAYVLFVILGLVAVLVGRLVGWQWIRNSWFRIAHLTMILVVVVESLLSITCPLTTLENYWRRLAGQEVSEATFVGQLAHDLLFFDCDPSQFVWIYCAFGAAVLFSWVVVPPNCLRWLPMPSGEKSPENET